MVKMFQKMRSKRNSKAPLNKNETKFLFLSITSYFLFLFAYVSLSMHLIFDMSVEPTLPTKHCRFFENMARIIMMKK
jgi:hypothetical protein